MATFSVVWPDPIMSLVMFAYAFTVWARPGRSSALRVYTANLFCTALLYGRAWRLTALFGVFLPGREVGQFLC